MNEQLFVVTSDDFEFPKHTVFMTEYDEDSDDFQIIDCDGNWRYVQYLSPKDFCKIGQYRTTNELNAEYIQWQAGQFEEVFSGSASEEEYTGGSTSYYKVWIDNPTSIHEQEPYQSECNDVIEALGMNYAEGNAFKALWRKAAARQGKKKKGYDNGLYDSEKVRFFGERLVIQSKTNK